MRTPTKDDERILSELEAHYQSKLDSVRARLGKQGKAVDVPVNDSVNLKIGRKIIILSWD